MGVRSQLFALPWYCSWRKIYFCQIFALSFFFLKYPKCSHYTEFSFSFFVFHSPWTHLVTLCASVSHKFPASPGFKSYLQQTSYQKHYIPLVAVCPTVSPLPTTQHLLSSLLLPLPGKQPLPARGHRRTLHWGWSSLWSPGCPAGWPSSYQPGGGLAVGPPAGSGWPDVVSGLPAAGPCGEKSCPAQSCGGTDVLVSQLLVRCWAAPRCCEPQHHTCLHSPGGWLSSAQPGQGCHLCHRESTSQPPREAAGALGVWMAFQEQVSGLRNTAPTSKIPWPGTQMFPKVFP